MVIAAFVMIPLVSLRNASPVAMPAAMNGMRQSSTDSF